MELVRVLKVGGYLYVRDPITDMKKLNGRRDGLSLNERGIPVSFYRRFSAENRLEITELVYFSFGPFNYLQRYAKFIPADMAVSIDFFLSRLFSFNDRYHRTRIHHKVAPHAAALVLKKTR
jgi:hypothetical protein